ncbi:aldo/keto reductase [Campylobacter avium LMG 24591]|uniref:Aldo/keto reductase n=1 Tax=Campylobacter avium LMG 24591 TaxID=522484 RepID=A0A222MZ58_9BACT|nr:aldo/keto reductase [Campylobacter avium]ASQ31273.1 aldo/keto reductase [Campylobacter avium LMG 24591]OYD79947.1 aldo/keto reductase [Campylobacter avium]
MQDIKHSKNFANNSRRSFLKHSAKTLAYAVSLGAGMAAFNPLVAKNNNKGNTMQTITLNNGVKMPILGYGVYQIDAKETQRCVEDALEVGYRLIDTAQSYFNEEGVGAAIKASGIKREEIFVTTKLWVSYTNETKAKKAFDNSLKKLGLDYIDLYLIHQPFNDVYGAWRTMSKLYKDKKIRAIGVSNFYDDRLVDFCLNNEIKPALNQIECNPLHAQFQMQKLMKEYNVAMQSWASFGEGKNNMFSNPTIAKIGKKYNKTVAQVILRWLIQREIAVIPKTTRKERMLENFSVFDFTLDAKDMQTMASLDDKKSLFFDHRDPAMVKWLNEYKADL